MDEISEQAEDLELIREKLDFRFIINKHLDRIGRCCIDPDMTSYIRAIRTLQAFVHPMMVKEAGQVTLERIKALEKDSEIKCNERLEQWKKVQMRDAYQRSQMHMNIPGKFAELRNEETFPMATRVLEALMIFLDSQGMLLETGTEETIE